ncbi:MAG: CPBP family intramembrane glutamic endopeptidase [Marinoscillum sp.]
MKKILGYLKEYQRKHFDLRLYLLTALFLTCCIVFNYSLDFENTYLDPFRGRLIHWPIMLLWVIWPFVVTVAILHWFEKVPPVFRQRRFWIMTLIGFTILSLDRTFSIYTHLSTVMGYPNYRFFSKCINWSSSLLVNVLPLLMVYRIFESEKPRGYYGLSFQKTDFRPYFALLGIAVICIGIGSFFSDIQAYYPRYQRSGGDSFAEHNGLPAWVSVIIYELSYGSDFVAVELFFRGFLIHAFVKMLSGYAVLPMVVCYAFLHFGKPLTEAVSSVFGGYILGIVSYKTENVWGGIIIHVGVAWSMEVFGYLQQLL